MNIEEIKIAHKLLKKLRSLEKEDRIFKGGKEAIEAARLGSCLPGLTPIASAVITKLEEFLNFSAGGYPDKIKELISVAEEFFTIFLKK